MLPIWLAGYVDLFGELFPKVTNALLTISPSNNRQATKTYQNPMHKARQVNH